MKCLDKYCFENVNFLISDTYLISEDKELKEIYFRTKGILNKTQPPHEQERGKGLLRT